MGSQTLIVLRQGIASLTGGFYFDPHQGVFCNVVHLYLWLFLLTCPFFAYLYFPGTWLTWCIYCILTAATILGVKVINMALHRLYDRAQSLSDTNLKHQFVKITKETEAREDETGIEMKVMGTGSRGSVENAIHEASDENSMMSMENVNSIIDLKVDVHRKNSYESIELMFYPPSRGSQQDQQSIAGSASVSKSLRSNNTETGGSSGGGGIGSGLNAATAGCGDKYLTVYPEREVAQGNNSTAAITAATTISLSTSAAPRQSSQHLLRKSSEDFKRRYQHRLCLERQRSLDTAHETRFATPNETFLHSLASIQSSAIAASSSMSSKAATTTSIATTASSTTSTSNPCSSTSQRLTTTTAATTTIAGPTQIFASLKSTTTNSGRNVRLQRHRSSETHDERLKKQNRSIYLPIHHEQHHHHHHHQQHHQQQHHRHHGHHRHNSSGASSIGALVGIIDANDIDLPLDGSTSAGVYGGADGGGGDGEHCVPPLWLGSSSDVYIEDDGFSKSDYGIERLNSDCSNRKTFLTQQQQQLAMKQQQQQQQQQQQRFRHQRQGGIKRRRHSNANFRGSSVGPNSGNDDVDLILDANIYGNTSNSNTGIAALGNHQASVRRIKSTALEISCPRPSISNLSPHPNSVEAINGQQQIRNPSNALLPPPSKCLVRNPHLNLCPKFGGSFGGSTGSNMTFGGTVGGGGVVNTSSDSTLALIEVVKTIAKTERKNDRVKERRSLKRNRKAAAAAAAAASTTTATDATIVERHKKDRTKAEGNVNTNDVDIDLLNIIETTMRLRDGHADEDDDDAVDDVPVQRRRKALGCRQNRRSVESDVGEILAADGGEDDDFNDEDDEDDDDDVDVDVDEFKDFDDNLEHILQDLQHTHNQLDELKATYEQEAKQRTDFDSDNQGINTIEPTTSVEPKPENDNGDDDEIEDENEAAGGIILRERLHSTDSETDNNKGSRSPLLNNRRNSSENAASKAADRSLQTEIVALQQKHKQTPPNKRALSLQQPPQLHDLQKRAEGDSGCPSSDCEQISASSKDMLLAGLDATSEEGDGEGKLQAKRTEDLKKTQTGKNLEEGDAVGDEVGLEAGELERKLSETSGKNLGAIPKIVKYREINETTTTSTTKKGNDDGPSTSAAAAATQLQLQKRRNGQNCQCPTGKNNNGGSSSATRDDRSLKSITSTKAISRTSSSTSSCSLNAYSLSADMQKMLWYMQGGGGGVGGAGIAIDERGRSLYGNSVNIDGQNITNLGSGVSGGNHTGLLHALQIPSNPSHIQCYQDALQTLSASSACPSSSVDMLSLSEHRAYVREKLRRSSKQISEPSYNASLAEFPQHGLALELPSAQLSSALLSNGNALTTGGGSGGGGSGRTTLQHHTPFGVVVASSALNSRNAMQGFFSSINEDRNVSTQTEPNALLHQHAGILHRGNHVHIDDFCEYWRPAGMISSEKPIMPKSFYKYHISFCGFERDFKISMDRLELLALFDRDLHWFHIVLSVVLCASVAYIGSTILQHGYYKDIFAFVFCAVIAGSQYSLVKSVQPDAASPIHGFNKTVAYSRAIYFCMCGGLLLLFEHLKQKYAATPPADFIFFGVRYSPAELNLLLLQIMYILLLCFPLIFSLGLFPQINTFLMYLLEQVDMHVFGGNAAGSLTGSFCCVLRSFLGISLLYGPLYAALGDGRGTQYIVFSIFCAMLIPLGYHLSRSASDFSHLWALIKTCIVSSYRDDDDDDDDDELSGSASALSLNKKQNATNKRRIERHSSERGDLIAGRRETAQTGVDSNEQIEMSSIEKLSNINDDVGVRYDELSSQRRRNRRSKSKASSLSSSSQTVGGGGVSGGKPMSSSKKAINGSSSYVSMDNAGVVAVGAGSSIAESGMERELNDLSKASNTLCDVTMIPPLENEEHPESSANSNDGEQDNNNDNEEGEKEVGAEVNDGDHNVQQNGVDNGDNEDDDDGEGDDEEDNEDEDDHDDDDDGDEVDEDEEADKISNSSTTHPGDMSTLTAGGIGDGVDGILENGTKLVDGESPDPLPKKLQTTVNTRLKNDLVVMTFLAVIVLGLHCSTVFTVLQPDLNIVFYAFTGALGLILHYIIPQMRKHMPWLCFARPLLRQKEFGQFEVHRAPKVMWFEKVYIYLCMLERNVLFPLLIISALTADATNISQKFGVAWGTLIVSVCALKFIRNAYSDPTNQYLIVIFTVLLFRIDFAVASETFLIDYFFVSLAYRKCCDFLLKLQFIVTYIAPWQITWGSAFHAFAQPFSVPHSAMLFLQAGVSAILSTPLNPFLGSAIFLTSYVRPIKFWERDYNTRRIDHSNTRLVSQLERDLGADDNNLNSIFYEHLTRSLQHSLCGDLLLGRWGNVNQGDCFVLASDYLNCLVHIIELGNGLCTFQMRGLEFRGTYCQQREVEAITEDVEDNDGCCCCDPGHLPRMLSANAMFSTRWLAWQVVAAQYVLEGYSISDNLASATLQVFEYRKVLITYYIKSIIYYVIKNPKLEQWLESTSIQDALQHTLSRQFADLDPIFNHNLDEDFDFRTSGVTRSSFCYVYLNWINFCCDKRKENQQAAAAATATASMLNTPQTQHYHATGLSPSNSHVNPNSNNNNNDSKSTPNLSTAKSQSQQQLRARPQKSATMMSSSTMVNNNAGVGGGVGVSGGVGGCGGGDPMATSQSYANIMRQTSESAPGLSGIGVCSGGSGGVNIGATGCFNYALTTSSAAATASATANSTTTTVGGGCGFSVGTNTNHPPQNSNLMRTPLSFVHGLNIKMPIGGEDNPAMLLTTSTTTHQQEFCDKPTIKLKVPTVAKDSPIVSLCLALSLLARRSLANASHGSITGVDLFLHGLHALFKGDFRITSARDEWVFADMDLLHAVVAPAVKMALKLQQDHISNPDEFLDPLALYEAIDTCAKDLVISHEADPVWRSAVLRGAPNLLALRHVMEDGSDEYRIIRLSKRFLSFRVIKLNRECVRGLWAGQQQELIYLRNRNPERGSIQNAKQALRNIINSSCDQPIGYPIYVSPLTTSYADTNEQLCELIGGAITLESIKSTVFDWWQHIRERCRQGCSSGSAMSANQAESSEIAPHVYISAPLYNTLTITNCMPTRTPPGGGGGGVGLGSTGGLGGIVGSVGVGGATLSSQFGSDGLAGTIRGGGLAVLPLKPTSTTLFASFLHREQENMRDLRELRGLRKSQTQERQHAGIGGGGMATTTMTGSSQRGERERERRATLPIASTSLGVTGGVNSSSGVAITSSIEVSDEAAENENDDSHTDLASGSAGGGNNSPRYANKISTSSGNLGFAEIITSPGDYPRKINRKS